VPTDKRQRKKERSRARQEAVYAAHRRAALRRRGVAALVAVGLLVAVVFLVSQMGDDEEQDVATDATTSTVAPPTTAAAGPPKPCPPVEGAPERTTSFPAPPPDCIEPAKTYTAMFETDVGSFTAALDPERAPRTVNNFVYLARYRYYDGITFHRVIPGFVVQGGDPQGTGSGDPGYKFADELPEEGEYEIGSLAMANSGPDTNGSQFFVVTGDQGAGLPPKYSLFGKVTAGLDVVKKIEADGSPEGAPKTLHRIVKVTITEK
jgi:cyclophilin family peptidyl-prolyl cis-trans isomerase